MASDSESYYRGAVWPPAAVQLLLEINNLCMKINILVFDSYF